MLKSRVLTILVIAPLAIAVVLLFPTMYFAFVMLCCVTAGAYEWGRLLKFSGGRIATIVLALALCLWYFESLLRVHQWIYALAVLWWLLAVPLVVYYQHHQKSFLKNAYLQVVIGSIVLVSAWFALIRLHDIYGHGPALTLYVLMIFWAADIGAYVVGKWIGRTKLVSNVSPGKTVEGVFGGLVAVILLGIGGTYYFSIKPELTFVFIMLTVVTALLSIVGDLYESIMKREAGVKDSGKLLPGHGGMLDRIDSVLAGSPVFTLGYLLLVR